MATWRERVNEMMTELQQERDELKVKAALGKAEMKDEIAELDDKLDALKAKAAVWADKADDELDEFVDDAKKTATEWMGDLKSGFQKLRARLTDDETPPAPPA